MPTYTAHDGTELAYRAEGSGEPVLVWPGGPARDAAYLEGLGGLAGVAGRRLVVPDPRGTGASPAPRDPSGYAASHLAEDLEALREHLGLDAADVLAHSAGCTVALLHAARHPERVRRLVLVTPATSAVGLDVSDEEWEARAALRSDEPWFTEAKAALDADDPSPQTRQAMSPFLYGPWTDAARRHAASDTAQRNRQGTAAFRAALPDPGPTRTALERLEAPVRVIVGELDLMPGPELGAELAGLFRDGRCSVQAGAGHFPWVDDASRFAELAADALVH